MHQKSDCWSILCFFTVPLQDFMQIICTLCICFFHPHNGKTRLPCHTGVLQGALMLDVIQETYQNWTYQKAH